MSKNNFQTMKTPTFRHPNRRGVSIPKYHRTRYGALQYFASITRPIKSMFDPGFAEAIKAMWGR